MAKRRKVRKSKTRKVKRKGARRVKRTNVKAIAKNRKALWGTYQSLQKKVDVAWAKVRSDIKRKAKPQILIRDRNHLLLLLGECNYMARECMRFTRGKARRR